MAMIKGLIRKSWKNLKFLADVNGHYGKKCREQDAIDCICAVLFGKIACHADFLFVKLPPS